WGSGFNGGNADAQLVRLAYRGGPRAPVAAAPVPVPGTLALDPVYPNPATGRATLAFTLPAPGPVRVEVFDVVGRRVAVLAEGFRAAGAHTLAFAPGALPGGVYVCRLTTPAGTRSRPLVVLR